MKDVMSYPQKKTIYIFIEGKKISYKEEQISNWCLHGNVFSLI